MRVIAGKARRLQLVTPAGMDTRPTTDRIKETLFNMIQYDLQDVVFVDLFAGSGAIGIEALSRGAKRCYFADTSNEAVGCIKKNLEVTHLSDQAVVYMKDASQAIASIETMEKRADIIFMDPPYRMEMEKAVLTLLKNSRLVDEDTLIIIEEAAETSFDYLSELGYELVRIKQYGKNAHFFIRKRS